MEEESNRPTAQQVVWVFRCLSAHLIEGGTFESLIRDRMGFVADDYDVLLSAGGMEISNALNEAKYSYEKTMKELEERSEQGTAPDSKRG